MALRSKFEILYKNNTEKTVQVNHKIRKNAK